MVEIFFLHQLLSARKQKFETKVDVVWIIIITISLSFTTLMLLSAPYRVLMHKNIAPVGAKHNLRCSVGI